STPALAARDRFWAALFRPSARPRLSAPRYSLRAAPSDSTRLHPQSRVPTSDGSRRALSAGRVVFFSDVCGIGTGDPVFGPLPADAEACQRPANGFAPDGAGREAPAHSH